MTDQRRVLGEQLDVLGGKTRGGSDDGRHWTRIMIQSKLKRGMNHAERGEDNAKRDRRADAARLPAPPLTTFGNLTLSALSRHRRVDVN
jgi:hypothetical protein